MSPKRFSYPIPIGLIAVDGQKFNMTSDFYVKAFILILVKE